MPDETAAISPAISPDELYRSAIAQLTGKGAPQDIADAIKGFEGAAAAGHVGATTHLAFATYFGYGGRKATREETVRLATIAAEAGDPAAMLLLGFTLAWWSLGQGKHEEQRFEKALRWYRAGAELGNAECKAQLGRAYLYGEGCPADADQAYRMSKEAVEQGVQYAKYYLGRCFEDGCGCPKNPAKAMTLYRSVIDDSVWEFKINLSVAARMGAERKAAKFRLGRLLDRIGRKDAGLALVEAAAAEDHADALAYLNAQLTPPAPPPPPPPPPKPQPVTYETTYFTVDLATHSQGHNSWDGGCSGGYGPTWKTAWANLDKIMTSIRSGNWEIKSIAALDDGHYYCTMYTNKQDFSTYWGGGQGYGVSGACVLLIICQRIKP